MECTASQAESVATATPLIHKHEYLEKEAREKLLHTKWSRRKLQRAQEMSITRVAPTRNAEHSYLAVRPPSCTGHLRTNTLSQALGPDKHQRHQNLDRKIRLSKMLFMQDREGCSANVLILITRDAYVNEFKAKNGTMRYQRRQVMR